MAIRDDFVDMLELLLYNLFIFAQMLLDKHDGVFFVVILITSSTKYIVDFGADNALNLLKRRHILTFELFDTIILRCLINLNGSDHICWILNDSLATFDRLESIL